MRRRKKGILISVAIAAVLLITVIVVLLPMIEFILDGDALRQQSGIFPVEEVRPQVCLALLFRRPDG